MKVIKSSNIQSLSIKVSEQINDKYILDFLRTNLASSDIELDSNSFFYFTFLKEYLSYEIIVFTKDESEFILEPFVLQSFYTNEVSNSIDLFLTNSYFVIYENKIPLLFKNISSLSKEDIESFILQTYKIKIDNTYIIDEQKLLKIEEEYISKNSKFSSFKFYPFKEDKSFRIFTIFIVIATAIFSYIIYNKSQKSITIKDHTLELQASKNKYQELKKIYQNSQIKPVSNMFEFFKYLKLNDILIDTIVYKNKMFQTILIHKNKQNLLDIFTMYSKNISMNSMVYDDFEEEYKMEISIEL
jgi:hypothetical protein